MASEELTPTQERAVRLALKCAQMAVTIRHLRDQLEIATKQLEMMERTLEEMNIIQAREDAETARSTWREEEMGG